MGEVYRARDTRLDRTVAIKILPAHLSDNPEAKQRFDREARAISSLNHPNICTLYDVGHQDGMDYLVMEFLEGETLASRLAKGPLAPEQVLKYGIEICEGLEKAHRTGVIHTPACLKPPAPLHPSPCWNSAAAPAGCVHRASNPASRPRAWQAWPGAGTASSCISGMRRAG
jgi:serine/threonine protein kinase